MSIKKNVCAGIIGALVMGGIARADNDADIKAALEQLSSANTASRQEALDRISDALARQFQQNLALQKVLLQLQSNMAAQMRLMTNGALPPNDADVNTPGLMEFNYALSNFGVKVMGLPAAQRDATLTWALQKENLPIVGHAFSRDPEARMQAAQELAGAADSPAITWVLLQLLRDPEQAVNLTAMETLAGRKAEPEIINALWDRITLNVQQQSRARQSMRSHQVAVQGKNVTVRDPNAIQYSFPQDVDVVANLLIHYDDPSIKEKLDALFREIGAGFGGNNEYRWQQFLPNYGGGRDLMKVVLAYKPTEAAPFFAKMLESARFNDGNGQDMQINVNGKPEKYHRSQRIMACYLLILVSGQDPDTYGIVQVPNYGNDQWGVKGGAEEEAAAVKKLRDWWKEHEKEYPSKIVSTVGLP